MHGKGHSAHCKREQSGMGSSQPCTVTETEVAALAIQPPGATWRHYNPERGERVMRKAALARCGLSSTTAAQHSRRERRATALNAGPRQEAAVCQQSSLTSRSVHPAKLRSCRTPSNSPAIRAFTALSFASNKHAQTAKQSRGS